MGNMLPKHSIFTVKKNSHVSAVPDIVAVGKIIFNIECAYISFISSDVTVTSLLLNLSSFNMVLPGICTFKTRGSLSQNCHNVAHFIEHFGIAPIVVRVIRACGIARILHFRLCLFIFPSIILLSS